MKIRFVLYAVIFILLLYFGLLAVGQEAVEFEKRQVSPMDFPEIEIEEEPEKVLLGEYTISHYTSAPDENGGYTITSTGTPIIAGRTAAIAKGTLDYGTVIYIEGVGERVIEDCGIREGYIDVAVSDKQTAFELGTFKAKVWILKGEQNV